MPMGHISIVKCDDLPIGEIKSVKGNKVRYICPYCGKKATTTNGLSWIKNLFMCDGKRHFHNSRHYSMTDDTVIIWEKTDNYFIVKEITPLQKLARRINDEAKRGN